MLTADGPQLIEYNARFGDPECQVLMMRLESDLVELIDAACSGRLGEIEPKWRDEAALTVVMAAPGYPGTTTKGTRSEERRGGDECVSTCRYRGSPEN